MNRTDLQTLAELRIQEAKILLDAAAYPGAFYLAGYSVECALKACIAKETKQHDFPAKPEQIRKAYSHKLDQLLHLAKLESKLEAEMRSNLDLSNYWSLVVSWDEEKRYVSSVAEIEARDIYNAIADPRNGVLQWLKKWW